MQLCIPLSNAASVTMSHLLHCFPSIMTNLSLNLRESLYPPLKIRPLSRITTLALSKENLHHQENTSIRTPSNFPAVPHKLSPSFLIQNLMAATHIHMHVHMHTWFCGLFVRQGLSMQPRLAWSLPCILGLSQTFDLHA